MYSIPLFLLIKETNILSQSDIQEHQNFCKLFSMAQTSYEKKLEDSKTKNGKNIHKKEKELSAKVWSWFENLSIEEKLKICTIKNNWVIRILIQLSFIHFLDNKTTFKPKDEMNVSFTINQNYPLLYDNVCFCNPCFKKRKFYPGYNEDDYYNFYFEMIKPEYSAKKKNNKLKEEIEYENKLLNNLVFFSLEKEDTLDAVSLYEDLLKDSKTLKQIFNYFSGKECFKERLYVMKYNNLYNFCYPIWMHVKSEFSLFQIITGFFEQQILITYEYYLYSKKINYFHNVDLIVDIYKEKENLENFLINRDKNKEKENIITLELISEMINKVKANVDFKKRKSNYKSLFDQLYIGYYNTTFYIGEPPLDGKKEDIYKDLIEEMDKNKIKGKEMHSLLNKITFMKLKDINNYREFVYFNLKKYLTEMRNKEFLDDLYNNNSNEHKTGKKKKKKKKKNKNSNLNNINNKEEDKIINNENNIEKNFSSNDENESNKDNINNNNYSSSSNSLKIMEEKNIKENKDNIKNARTKEEKIKTKEFFLFPINNKKNKNKIKNNETINSNQSLSEKNNIKINYLDKKEEKNINLNKEDELINNKYKSKTDIEHLFEESINRLEIINNKESKENHNQMKNSNYYINSPESTTTLSFEASGKDNVSISKEISDQKNENKVYNTNNNDNENKNQINMTINIINNQYIYQQYPFFNLNFDNFAFMQSQFFYYYHVPSDYFFETLTKEIKSYEDLTTKNIIILDKIRSKYFTKIEKMIKSGLNKKYEIKFGHYGSFFTNLSIEGSDVDILVYYKPFMKNMNFLEDIINLLNEHKEEFESINPRLSASVPVIVLQINISKEVDNEILKFLPYFENKDISHINIDLTFTSKEKEFKRPEQIVNYINKSLKDYEEIRPLLLVIKRYFRVMKMNKSFTGGLSSFSLFLLILAFLKNNKDKMNLGKFLYYIIEKYSFFDFKNYGIDVEFKDCYFGLNTIELNNSDLNKQKNENIFENNRIEEIKIIDPLTKFNVAKSSFKLNEIKNTFNKALYTLKYESLKYQNGNLEEENDTNEDFSIIKKLFSIK